MTTKTITAPNGVKIRTARSTAFVLVRQFTRFDGPAADIVGGSAKIEVLQARARQIQSRFSGPVPMTIVRMTDLVQVWPVS